jgi:hypothetical protein
MRRSQNDDGRLVQRWEKFLNRPECKERFGDQKASILKRWLFLSRVPLAALSGVVFLIVFIAVAVRGDKVGLSVRLLYALWTFGVPLYFFVETVYGVDPEKAKINKAQLEQFKATQDAARPVWAACAAALSVLLLKGGAW